MLAVTRSMLIRLAAAAVLALAFVAGHGAVASRRASPPRKAPGPSCVPSIHRDAAHVTPAVARPGHVDRAPVNACVWSPRPAEPRIAPCLPAEASAKAGSPPAIPAESKENCRNE